MTLSQMGLIPDKNIWILFVCIGFLLLQGCKRSSEKAPNLLVITVDTTRADRLGCYGYKRAKTPAMDALAKEGVLFENAQSCVPLTLPSHTTIFTGLIPPEHGLRVNGENALGADIPTMAEILKARGYQTGAVVASSVLDSLYGLNRGFDWYEDDIEGAPDSADGSLDKDLPHGPYRDGKVVADLAIEWIKKCEDGNRNKSDKPWFLWAHFYDPHTPRNYHQDLFGGKFKEAYDAEVAYMDMQISRLLVYLKEHKLNEDTLIVLVGDHGEGLNDHGEHSHCFFLYQTTQHVPLILKWSNKIPPGRRVSSYVSLADIMPTVFDIMNVDPFVYESTNKQKNKRMNKVQKRSFAAAAFGEDIESRPCYMETLWGYHLLRWSPLFAVIDGGKKYIQAPTCELYDLNNDPGELNNIFSKQQRLADELAMEIEKIESLVDKPMIVKATSNSEQLSKLKSLGYTSGSGSDLSKTDKDLSQLKDPKDYKEIVTLQNEVQMMLDVDPKDPRVYEGCRFLIKEVPDTPVFYYWYAKALAARGDKQEACNAYLQAIKLDELLFKAHNGLGVLLASSGKYEQALPYLKKAHELEPSDKGVLKNVCRDLFNIGKAKLRKGKVNDAKLIYKEMLKLNPGSTPAKNMLRQLNAS